GLGCTAPVWQWHAAMSGRGGVGTPKRARAKFHTFPHWRANRSQITRSKRTDATSGSLQCHSAQIFASSTLRRFRIIPPNLSLRTGDTHAQTSASKLESPLCNVTLEKHVVCIRRERERARQL